MNTFGRILIIDDCGVTTYFLRAHLSHFGFEVKTVGTGEDGLMAAEQFVPDAIILDRKLPGMMGEEVCRRLRAHEVLRHCAIVMLTSSADESLKREIIALGADEYIVKPIQPDDIARRLENAIAARRAARDRETRAAEGVGMPQATRGQITPTLHAHLVERNAELLGYLKTVRDIATLSLKDRGTVDRAIALVRDVGGTLETAEVLAFEALEF